MKIGFDAKRLFNNFTGLGNYSRFVVQALLEFETNESMVLYSPSTAKKDHPDIKPIATAPQVEVVTPPDIYRWTKTTSLWRSFGIGRERSAQHLDVFHGLSQELPSGLPARVRKVVTVHDLIFLRFPALYSRIDARIYTHKVAKACREADVVVAISEQTARDVMTYLGTPKSKIEVVYQGAHPQFNVRVRGDAIDAVRKMYGLPAKYLLTVGTIEPRKNMLAAVQAMAKLPESLRIPLVIVGRETAYKHTVAREAEKLNVTSHVRFLHAVSFADLPALYQGAALFVYPSLFEGFGIPIVESLLSGVPVVTSTGSCFSEAGGPAALYADSNDTDALARQMACALADEPLRKKMIETGHEYVKRFSAKEIATALMRIYQQQN
ncbi:MAG TPA: glycosyltransferase family 1 protein [Chryseolinea sp.]|nr:glycosyltransferase family 1 protein [Chryseolinea sp.]